MRPATYAITLTENATNALAFTRSGVASALGWSARLDVRENDDPESDLYLSLTSPSSGITLSSNGSVLSITVTVSEAQTDALVASILGGGKKLGNYSLKLTKPDTTTEQLLKGALGFTRTVTP